jgi:hypothetical protein
VKSKCQETKKKRRRKIKMSMRLLIPTVKLDNQESIPPAKAINPKIISIRVQDLLKRHSAQLNSIYYKIKEAGGIHKYLGYKGKVILSSIMRDDILRKINNPIYFDVLENLKPDYFMTSDCESYDNEFSYSKKQIRRSLINTVEVLRLFPEIEPIGLIKGCERNQVLAHHKFLKGLGVKIFVLHAGDFFRHGNESQIQKLKNYASLIKDEDNTVLLASFGSQKRLEEFLFIDGYITYSHVVNAQNGIILNGRRKEKNNSMTYHEACIHNLKQMFLNISNLRKQTKLEEFIKKWAVEPESQELIIQKQ